MAYTDHPTTTVSSLAGEVGEKYNTYKAYVKSNVPDALTDISSNLSISATNPASEIHIYDATSGASATGDIHVSINDGDTISLSVAQLPFVFNNFNITKLEVQSNTTTDDLGTLAFFK
tara:strand:+ start:866 stop:1219 length:354 start_codon:yes stop_codon:yes gene_type:complete